MASGEPKPDLVHISNALLLGVAGEIPRVAQLPIVCSLQDEDTWVDAMDPVWRERCWNIIAEKARDVDLFIAVSKWYAEKSQRAPHPDRAHARCAVGDRMRRARTRATRRRSARARLLVAHSTPISVSPELVDAFIELKKHPRLATLKLRATGGRHQRRPRLCRSHHAKARPYGVHQDIEIVEDFRQVGAASVHPFAHRAVRPPRRKGEAFGLFIVERVRAACPSCSRTPGPFAKWSKLTGGGIVYDGPADKSALVESLKKVLLDPRARPPTRPRCVRGRPRTLHQRRHGRKSASVLPNSSPANTNPPNPRKSGSRCFPLIIFVLVLVIVLCS